MKLSTSRFAFAATTTLFFMTFLDMSSSVAADNNSEIHSTSSIKKLRRNLKATKAPKQEFFDEQVFYSDEETELYLEACADDGSDEQHLNYMIDLGALPGSDKKNPEDTTAIIEASFTTRMLIEFAGYGEDDDFEGTGFAKTYLSIFAYSGCNSADSCEAANIEPTPLIPARVEMVGWERDFELDHNNDIVPIDDIALEDTYTSTNQATFVLAGKGTDDIFLKGVISVHEFGYPGTEDSVYIEVTVKNWVMVIQDGQSLKVTKSNGYQIVDDELLDDDYFWW